MFLDKFIQCRIFAFCNFVSYFTLYFTKSYFIKSVILIFALCTFRFVKTWRISPFSLFSSSGSRSYQTFGVQVTVFTPRNTSSNSLSSYSSRPQKSIRFIQITSSHYLHYIMGRKIIKQKE